MSNINTYLKNFSHFEHLPGGRFLLWVAEECECCGEDCEGPNSADVGISGDALGAFRANGVTERSTKSTAGELGYSEGFGGAVCSGCYDEHDEEG